MTARWQPHATLWLDAEATWLDVAGPRERRDAAAHAEVDGRQGA